MKFIRHKALTESTSGLDICIQAMTLKTKYTTSNVNPWKEKVLANVKKKMTELNPIWYGFFDQLYPKRGAEKHPPYLHFDSLELGS